MAPIKPTDDETVTEYGVWEPWSNTTVPFGSSAEAWAELQRRRFAGARHVEVVERQRVTLVQHFARLVTVTPWVPVSSDLDPS